MKLIAQTIQKTIFGRTHKMKKTIIYIIICSVVALSSHTAEAQKKWNFQFGIGGTLNSGNINNIGFRHEGSAARNDSVLAFDSHYKFLYSEENHLATNRGVNGGIKFDIYQYNKFSPFFAYEFITNHFKGYDWKSSLIAGAKYRIYSLPGKCDYSISAAIVGDYVNYYVTDPAADTLDGYVARISLRAKIKQKIGEGTNLNHTTFYQPSILDFNDYIITSVTKIENKLNKHLYLDFIFEYDYRSVVPQERSKYDIATEVAIRYKF